MCSLYSLLNQTPSRPKVVTPSTSPPCYFSDQPLSTQLYSLPPPYLVPYGYPDDPFSYSLLPPLAPGQWPFTMAPRVAAGHVIKLKAKGVIHYSPFELLDEHAMQEVRNFSVTPFGNIRDQVRHIPYNSGKKDFHEKTGREAFEVFWYEFTVPGDHVVYQVMWDYNVGLVRMTPFFKVCKYSKTAPAKMLNLNPGLREITHSITGGSISAQGYWMPFECAKAVCATFCSHIAGALIPLFGPDFPSICAPPASQYYGRMMIDAEIINTATHEAAASREAHIIASATASPQRSNGLIQTPRPNPYSAFPTPTSLPSPDACGPRPTINRVQHPADASALRKFTFDSAKGSKQTRYTSKYLSAHERSSLEQPQTPTSPTYPTSAPWTPTDSPAGPSHSAYARTITTVDHCLAPRSMPQLSPITPQRNRMTSYFGKIINFDEPHLPVSSPQQSAYSPPLRHHHKKGVKPTIETDETVSCLFVGPLPPSRNGSAAASFPLPNSDILNTRNIPRVNVRTEQVYDATIPAIDPSLQQINTSVESNTKDCEDAALALLGMLSGKPTSSPTPPRQPSALPVSYEAVLQTKKSQEFGSPKRSRAPSPVAIKERGGTRQNKRMRTKSL